MSRNAAPRLAIGVLSVLPLACGDPGGETPDGSGARDPGIGGTAGASGGSGGTSDAGSGGQLGTSGQAGAAGQAGSAGMLGSGGSSSGGTGAAGGSGGSSGDGGSSGGTGGAMGCAAASILAPGDSNRTVQVGGASRSYILHVPASYTGETPAPLVLDFHAIGGTGSGQRRSSGFAALSDREGFVIAWPNGIDNAWNVGPCCTRSRDVDDVGFARAIVAAVSAEGCIDATRVYATGFSMGGGMSHYLGCKAADVFAAVTPSAFDLLEENRTTCAPSRPISVLSFRGTGDFVVPYVGGASTPPNGCCPPIHFLGAEGTLAAWGELNGCTGAPTTTGNTQRYAQCAGGVEVGLQTLSGGHAPGPAATAWDFLKTKSLP